MNCTECKRERGHTRECKIGAARRREFWELCKEIEATLKPCEFCGRMVLAGGFCCEGMRQKCLAMKAEKQ